MHIAVPRQRGVILGQTRTIDDISTGLGGAH